MTDYTELKRLAEAAPEGPWYQHGGIKQVVNHDCETVCETFEEDGNCPTARFIAAANPTAVLALLAENERLESEAVYSAAGFDAAREEIARLKAEVAGLKTGYEAYERVNAELKAEVEGLRKAIADIDGALEREYWGEYAGLEETRAILDAAMGQGEQS